jgi:hypothetical protein
MGYILLPPKTGIDRPDYARIGGRRGHPTCSLREEGRLSRMELMHILSSDQVKGNIRNHKITLGMTPYEARSPQIFVLPPAACDKV